MKKFALLIAFVAAVLSVCSCGDRFKRTDSDYERVFIYYVVGYNDLQSFLETDIKELLAVDLGAYVPAKKDNKAIVIISHFPQYYGSYSTETAPVIEWVYSDAQDKSVIRDTLLRLPTGAKLTDKETMSEALGYVKEHFSSDHYVMSYTSHGTGWLPAGFYGNNSNSSITFDAMPMSADRRRLEGVPIVPHLPGPLTKTIGCEYHHSDGSMRSFEMEIATLAQSIPMHLDCLFLDACLMGGVEVAYDLADVASKIAFSAAEVPTNGYDYTIMSQKVLKTYDPVSVCKSYYDDAMAQKGWDRSATISLVNTANIKMLASECKEIFTSHREALSKISPNNVQRFGRFQEHWYYDLRDIVVNSGVTEFELGEFDALLRQCVEYQAATDTLFNDIVVKNHCGMTMYLPSNGHKTLDEYYRNLGWNKATGLVE